MIFEEAMAMQAALQGEVHRLSEKLQRFPKGQMGLTPDAVKFSPEFRAAKSEFDNAFKTLRHFNSHYIKAFKREIAASRRRCGRLE